MNGHEIEAYDREYQPYYCFECFFVSQLQYVQFCALEHYISKNQLMYLTGEVDQIQIVEFK